MPESSEQYFSQPAEEKPKSLQEIKEEKGLILARQIRELRTKLEQDETALEEAPRLLKLIEELESLFKPSLFETSFKRGEIFDYLEELSKKIGEEITDADNIHFQPDGILAGLVQLEEGNRWFPFLWDGTRVKVFK